MVGAFLTTIFFSLSAIFANRSIRAVGAVPANVGRLLVAALTLGVYAHLWGGGWGGAGFNWLLWSGVVGMGLGDLALFAALPLLGSRLTVLMTQCLAAPIAALAEYLWLGTVLTSVQLLWGGVILLGVMGALMPSRSDPPKVKIRPLGFLWGLGSAAGQGLGAVLSRKASQVAGDGGGVDRWHHRGLPAHLGRIGHHPDLFCHSCPDPAAAGVRPPRRVSRRGRLGAPTFGFQPMP
jgi:drug/metabolite transporter (DMT)-like permease